MNEAEEKDSLFPQGQSDITETNTTETDTMKSEAGTNTDISPDSKEEVHTSELSPSVKEDTGYPAEIGTLTAELQAVNQRLDTMTNITLVIMVGLGLVVGILACNIFARYFTS